MGLKGNTALAMLVLRILSLVLLVGSAVVFLTNSYKISNGDKTSFKDVYSYRYVIATAAFGAAYLILQLPFATYYAATEKRLIAGNLLPGIDFYADKLVALVLATGVGAGFGVSYELKRVFPDFFDTLIVFAESSTEASISSLVPLLQEAREKIPGFFVRGYIGSGVLLGGCVLMVVVSVLSSINRTK